MNEPRPAARTQSRSRSLARRPGHLVAQLRLAGPNHMRRTRRRVHHERQPLERLTHLPFDCRIDVHDPGAADSSSSTR